MANSVLAQIARKNSYDYECIHQESILCEKARSEGFYWRIPLVRSGVLVGYTFRKSDTKPTPDSMKTIRVTDGGSGIVYFVAVADNASAELFNEACNACCDGDTDLPTVELPTIIIEEEGCLDEDGNFTYFTYIGEMTEGEVLRLTGSVNGEALPDAPAEGFADLAALTAWTDINWPGVTVTVDEGTGKIILTVPAEGATEGTGAIDISIEKYFESNAPGALAGGEHYHVEATVNETELTAIDGVADAALTTVDELLNASAEHAFYGTWSVVGGKIRLVGKDVALSSADIVVTKVA